MSLMIDSSCNLSHCSLCLNHVYERDYWLYKYHIVLTLLLLQYPYLNDKSKIHSANVRTTTHTKYVLGVVRCLCLAR